MILVDARGGAAAHMVSTASLDELHAFAELIGLRREWFQNGNVPHYDLTSRSKVAEAVRRGAAVVKSREIVRQAFRP